MFVETIKKDIMNWGGAYTQIRMHSGRTDGVYGHRDTINRSGLGSYHYHHRVPAHLHPDGLCPYKNEKVGSIINPYTGKRINLGTPYLYGGVNFYPLNMVARTLTANDGLGVESNSNSDGGSFYACASGDSSLDKLGEKFVFSYPTDSLGLKDNEFFETDDGMFLLLAASNGYSTTAYINMDTVRGYITKDGYFTDLSEDATGCWSFAVRKPFVQIISPEDGDSLLVGNEVTVRANIENVVSARFIAGKLYPMGYIDGFEERIYNIENQSTVEFSKFKLTEDVVGSAFIENGSITIKIEGHIGGTTIDAEMDARTLGDSVSIRVDNTGIVSPASASEELVAFLKNYEDFYAMPYRGLDSQNRTVGYGHVIDEITEGTKYNNGITEEESTDLLRKDLEEKVYDYLNPWLNQNSVAVVQKQYDSLVSFTFNAGPSWITVYEDLRDILLNGNVTYEVMYTEFMTWITVQGERALGLYRRRMDELNIFFNGDYNRNYPDAPDWF